MIKSEKTSEQHLPEGYRTFMRLTSDAVVVLDLDLGRFVDFNENALRLFKLDRPGLSSADPVQLSPPQQPSGQSSVVAASGMIDRAVRGETPVFDWVHRNRHGEHIPCKIRLARLPGTNRTLIGGSLIDMSEHRAVEEELNELRSQLAHLSRISTMSEIIAGVAHEVAQPIHAIGCFAQACTRGLKQESIDIPQLGEWMDGIQQAAINADEILRRMSHFTQDRQPNGSTCDLRQVIGETMNLLAFEVERFKTNVEIKLSAQHHQVCADQVQIQQVLVNLLRNAFEACAATSKTKHRVCIESSSDGDILSIRVRDNGTGFTQSVHSQLFSPFFTTKAEGMGIGLAISRMILAAHGGELTAESSNGDGAVFSFTLPLADSQTS